MPTTVDTKKTSILTDLSSVIKKVQDKSNAKEISKNDQLMASSLIKMAQDRVKTAESAVDRAELSKKQAEAKLSPPPTKQVESGGKKGGMKTVVDTAEKKKLEGNVAAAQLQIDQAKAAVEAAQQEATDATAKKIVAADLSNEQQSGMSDLTKQIADLKALANQDGFDPTEKSFQDKLKKAVNGTTALAKDLPDSADPKLIKYWQGINGDLSEIQDKITQGLTPDTSSLDKRNNYAGFFQKAQQGFDTIIQNLQNSGADRGVIAEISGAKDKILNNKDTYLEGMNNEDDLRLLRLQKNINSLVTKIGAGQALTADDIASLSLNSDKAAEVLDKGGSSFEDVIAIPFRNIGNNLDNISKKLSGNADFKAMYDKLTKLYSGSNSYSQLRGLSVDDADKIYGFADYVKTINDAFRNGTPSADQISTLVQKGNAFATQLQGFGFSAGSTTTGTNGGTASSAVLAGGTPSYIGRLAGR